MSRRKAVAGIGLTAAGLVGVIALAPAAAADSNQYSIPITSSDPTWDRVYSDCGGLNGGSYYYVTQSVNVPGAGNYSYYDNGYYDGDSGTVDAYVVFYPNGTFNPSSPLANCVDAADDSSTLTFPSGGTYTMVVTTYSSGATGLAVFTISDISATGAGGEAAPPPPDMVQQVARSSVGSCDDVDDKDLSFGTDATGGWSESWAQWVHDGEGGAVCTRTLHYDTDRQQWTVQA